MPYKDPEKRKAYSKEYHKRHYQRNKAQYGLNRDRHRYRHLEWYRRLKDTFICIKCGEDDAACLDFHHIDGSTKEYNVGALARTGCSKQKILDEIAKCQVLCSNCHRKLHRHSNKTGVPDSQVGVCKTS